ncbi:MAG: uracil-DNA glycosylase family protein [Spirochaetaceae bacterium]|nr:uracil-DNA glycosylase family protein [Spirochaetaceae bacterium]
MDSQVINKLKELNFNNLIKLNTDINEYSYEHYIKNGFRHPIKGMCTICEENSVNICPSDRNFKLMAMGHGSTSNDILQASDQQELDTSSWKEEGVMFVFENPGPCVNNIYEKISSKGFSKYPSYKWFWIHNRKNKCEYPVHFQGRCYDEYVTSAMFTFKLKSLYITDIVKCGMNNKLGGDYKNTIGKSKKSKYSWYNQKCIENCLRFYFFEEIKIVKPRIIFYFGREAERIINEYQKEIQQLLPHRIILKYLLHPQAQVSNEKFMHSHYNDVINGLFEAGIISDSEKKDYLSKSIKSEFSIEKQKPPKLITQKKPKPETGKNNTISSIANNYTIREKMLDLKKYLEENGYREKIKPYSDDNVNNELVSVANNEKTFFYISLSHRDGFKFHWESRSHNIDWFNEAYKKILEIFPNSQLKPRQEIRLFIDDEVDENNYKERILKIINETREFMGY